MDKYKKLDTLFIKEFESFMTYQMRLNYLHLLDDKLVQSEVQDWSTHKTETVIIITNQYEEACRGLSLSNIASQLIQETGLDVIIFTGKVAAQESAVE